MPKLHYGSRGGVYYKKKGRKVYVSRFGSDGFDGEKFEKVLFENRLFWDDNPDKMSIAWTGYALHSLLDIDYEIFEKLQKVNQKVITFDSQGEFCDKENGAIQRPYIHFFANEETVKKILENPDPNIEFYYYLNDSTKKVADEDVILTYDDKEPFSILKKGWINKVNIEFFNGCDSTNLYACYLIYKKFCEKGSFLELINYLNDNSVGGKNINKKKYIEKKNNKENKFKNLINTISYIRGEYNEFIERVERLTTSGFFEKYKSDLIEEIHRLIDIHNKKYKELLDFIQKNPEYG